MSIDRGEVSPGDGVGAVRQVVPQGDVHDCGIAEIDSAVVVVDAASLGIENFDGAE